MSNVSETALQSRCIAVVFEYGTLNGGERSMLAVIDELAGGGEFEFVAIAPPEGPLTDALANRRIAHVPLVLREPSGERCSPEIARRRLLDAILASDADLVHANSLSMGRLTGAIADELDIPCIAHLRDIIKVSNQAIADLNRNRRLLAVSQATKSYHVQQGLDAERTTVLYNGVDCRRFHPRPPTDWLRRELRLPADSFLIATIGQIGLRKGQDVLAESAVLAADRLQNVHYLLIGERHSSKQESIAFEQSVIRRFAEAGLGNRLHCLGYRNDVDRLLNEVDLLVHPAHQEPLGRVLLEAAAAGTPVVATDVGGTLEILADGISARLVPAANASALAAALVELHNDGPLRHQFAAAARMRIENDFDIRTAAESLAQLWRSTLCGSPVHGERPA